jgi:hypothetical protein
MFVRAGSVPGCRFLLRWDRRLSARCRVVYWRYSGSVEVVGLRRCHCDGVARDGAVALAVEWNCLVDVSLLPAERSRARQP